MGAAASVAPPLGPIERMCAAISASVPVLAVITPAVWATTGLIHAIRSGPPQANPTFKDIEDAARLQGEQEERIRAAKVATEEAHRLAREAAIETGMARQAQQEAANAVRAAREDAERARREAKEVRAAAKRQADVQCAEAQRRETELCDEAQRRAAEAEEERSRIKHVQAEAQHQRQLADEEICRARDAQQAAEAAIEAAAAEMHRAHAVREEVLRKGIQPVVMPSAADLKLAKQRVDYREGFYHFAVAGAADSGKSSLINALRGLDSSDDGAAAVAVTETTLRIVCLPDADPANPFVWYDIPGAGTFQVSDWQYFNEQGLYVFDAIIVLIGDRVTSTDVGILRNCRLFGIPSYIVDSMSHMRALDILKHMPHDNKSEEQLELAAREKFISDTRQSVHSDLQAAEVLDQRVYIVSDLALFSVVKGLVSQEMEKEIIDEYELIERILSDAHKRRGTRPVAPSASSTHDL